MLSFASAAYIAPKELIGTFSANLETLPDATSHPDTTDWWSKNPEAWEDCRRNCLSPEIAIKKYIAWLENLPGKPVFVGYPAAYDFMFVYWYLIKYGGRSPFSHSALDIKTYGMAVLKTEYRKSTKNKMPKSWFDNLPHTHRALDDAIEQGALFCNMMAQNCS
ncbi:MAG: exonuclease [Pseudanabaenales cyanobacterium]|nr:exonuclease [Pseudanabaenales cyanobacterium]